MVSRWGTICLGQRIRSAVKAWKQLSRRSFSCSPPSPSSSTSPQVLRNRGTMASRCRAMRKPTVRLTVPIACTRVAASSSFFVSSIRRSSVVTRCSRRSSLSDVAIAPMHAVARLRTTCRSLCS
eukprot:scaffold340_cov256-Pinguiococcus_pyrenoidosus.AAC.51